MRKSDRKCNDDFTKKDFTFRICKKVSRKVLSRGDRSPTLGWKSNLICFGTLGRERTEKTKKNQYSRTETDTTVEPKQMNMWSTPNRVRSNRVLREGDLSTKIRGKGEG